MSVTEPGTLSRDHDIAAQDRFEAAGQSQAIDRRDDRLGEGTQRVKEHDDGVQEIHLARANRRAGLFQVGARAEGPAGSGHDDDARGRIVAPCLQLRGHGAHHLQVQGVHRRRTLQSDPADRAVQST
ncbi:hypothetical protein D9M72_282060 [compost metagenome]